jgi:hypothetical protein
MKYLRALSGFHFLAIPLLCVCFALALLTACSPESESSSSSLSEPEIAVIEQINKPEFINAFFPKDNYLLDTLSTRLEDEKDDTAIVVFTIRHKSGGIDKFEAEVRKESGTWKVAELIWWELKHPKHENRIVTNNMILGAVCLVALLAVAWLVVKKRFGRARGETDKPAQNFLPKKDPAISLPVKSNLRDFGIPIGKESSALRPAIEKFDKARAKSEKWGDRTFFRTIVLAYLVAPFLVFLGGAVLVIPDKGLWGSVDYIMLKGIGRFIGHCILAGGGAATVFLIPWTFFWFARMCFATYMKGNAAKELQQARNQYASDVNKYFKGVFKDTNAFWYDGQGLIYSNDICAYFSVDTGDFVAYNKSDIKDVTREHVHTGFTGSSHSTTQGRYTSPNHFGTGSYSGSTTTSFQAVNHYEWHLDILTGFAPHPKISVVVSDDDEGVAKDLIAQAYAVLKP